MRRIQRPELASHGTVPTENLSPKTVATEDAGKMGKVNRRKAASRKGGAV